ncbi:2-dehydropantoate 2-reductase [Piscinibacter sakaiensis]|uniref:2-dehydropantoate 2-reductase n=1 Tax=Piscinibacter sakaiensis TaxID=1547922 RepID=A0A0K8NXF1_PISS1|nr:2-dehydropantoate 2-reductase [Piscinibacter sakaiensis]GAP35077.1 2-dehydropantoate 2-reductase [Piscinibacter sakaiensis]
MKILILGAGGIGGYFGAQLLRSGADVSFLVRERRRAAIAAQGLRIESPHGDFTVHPTLVTAADARPVYDLVLLSPKAYDLDDALASLEGALGAAALLPFLNGLDHLEQLDRRYGRERVLGGVAQIAATLTAEGVVRQMSPLHSLTVGARDPAHAALARAFIAACAKAPFDSLLSEDITQALWDKWTFLATLAGMTTVCRGSIGEIVATAHGRALAERMYAECLAVAAASGQPVGEAARQRALGLLTAVGSPFTASMLRDLEAGQRTEHEHILGAMAARGQALGLPMDLVRLAYTPLAIRAARAAAAPVA